MPHVHRHPQSHSHRSKREQSSQSNLAKAQQFLNSGKVAEAELFFTRAVEADKSSSTALMSLGDFYFKQKNPTKAQASFARITALEPKNAVAWRNLAVSYSSAGNHQQAADAFQRAVLVDPEYTNAYHGLALSLSALNRPLEAIANFQQVIRRTPLDHEALFNFADALGKIGEIHAAEAAYQAAIAIHPNFAVAYCNLGRLYIDTDRNPLALISLAKAIEIAPDFAEGHNNYGVALQRDCRLTEALKHYHCAAALKPDFASAHGNLGSTYLALGDLQLALQSYRRALDVNPNDAAIHSNLLFTMQSDEAAEPAKLFAAYRAFAAHFETPQKAKWAPHTNHPDPSRRLRIGYVSGDLRNHAIAFFIEPILATHDRNQFDLIIYSNHAQYDEVSKRLANLVDRWTPCVHLSDDALAAQIRTDGIDILVDLSGHTAHNRLLTFARKPAPIQSAWMGYGDTTGLDAMDYRITDEWHDPVGLTDPYNSETLMRVGASCTAFKFVDDAPAVVELPALAGKGITLACLNSPRKIRPRVVALWSRILLAQPDATLLLCNAADDTTRLSLLRKFADAGIDASRIQFQPWMALPEFLKLHNRIDLALDPFPYNGCTTSLHAMWMGVPYVTLTGDRAVSRVGAGMLAFAKLQDWITNSEDAYFERVMTALADLPALNTLRQSLRPRLAADNIDRDVRITRELERAYRSMWQTWCAKNSFVTSTHL